MEYWCYALINNRLGEIYFALDKGKTTITGHCYLGKNETFNQKEVGAFQKDIISNQFTYYQHKYRHIE